MQYPNWLLHCLTYQDGIHIHVEPGNIFKTKDGIKMTEEITQEEDFVEIWTTDEDGKSVKVKIY